MASLAVKAYGAPQPGLHHEALEIDLPAVGPEDVLIKIKACGICHSDIHLACQHWGPQSSAFRLGKHQVSGHEVVGVVEEAGAAVKHLKPGQRVGVGWYKDSCRTCKWCLQGRHSTCDGSVATAAGGANGGFAEAIVVRADHAVAIPDGLADEHAAPLMCGGITVYSPLVDNDCVGKRVGVAGLGGLGAMGVQLAVARGNVVTAVSTTPDKAALARELGAAHFVNIRDEAAVKAAGDSLDVLIVTFNVAPPSWEPYLSLLDKHGVLVFVGAVPGPLGFTVMGRFFFHQLSIRTSITGGLGRIAELLRFAADHGIKPHVETFDFADINAALQKVVDNKVRFRAVLKW